MNPSALIMILAQCVIAVVVGLGIDWFLGWLGTDGRLRQLIMIVVWIIVGVFVILHLLRLAGMA